MTARNVKNENGGGHGHKLRSSRERSQTSHDQKLIYYLQCGYNYIIHILLYNESNPKDSLQNCNDKSQNTNLGIGSHQICIERRRNKYLILESSVRTLMSRR